MIIEKFECKKHLKLFDKKKIGKNREGFELLNLRDKTLKQKEVGESIVNFKAYSVLRSGSYSTFHSSSNDEAIYNGAGKKALILS